MKYFYIYVVLLIGLGSCSVEKYLPEGEKLYRGAIINIQKDPSVKESDKALKALMQDAIRPRKNKYLLGQPWKVWWWYNIGEPAREKGLKAFLRRKFAEPPVLSSQVRVQSTSENIQSLMENNGYFRTAVTGDTINSGYYTKAVYNAYVKPQYTINEIEWVKDSSDLKKSLIRPAGRSVLKKGQPYRLADIKAERDRLDLYLKTKGYYFFNPDYIMSYVDSTVGDRKVNLYLNIKNTTPDEAKIAYKINSITVYPNYSLTSSTLDTAKYGAVYIDTLYIRDTLNKFKPHTFTKAITYRPGSIYNSRRQNSSLNRLISLSAFKFVKNRFEKTPYDTTMLDVYYYLTPYPKKSIQAQVDAFTKDNNYMGGQASINIINRNTFGGAEQLNLKPYGGFETAVNNSLKGNNNYRMGINAALRIPRYAVPLLHIKENNFYMPNTNISLGYEWFRKSLFYTKNFFSGQYDFTWKTDANRMYMLAPFALSYTHATAITDTFRKQMAFNPALELNVQNEAILGSMFQFTKTSPRRQAVNKTVFKLGLDVSGNIAGLVTGAKSYQSKKIFSVPFAQYVKTDIGVHYTRKLTNGLDWANRLELGIGIPYNNSRVLPFAKQYSIGGAGTLRGFSTRGIGPGSHLPTFNDQRYFQIIGGDLRLLANTELRIPINKMFSTAVFFDAGNIWTKDTLTFGPKAQFSKTWLKEMAVNTGIGLRADLTFLLLRMDLGIPLRKPWYPDGKRWVFSEFNLASSTWRRENLVLNVAVGLPF